MEDYKRLGYSDNLMKEKKTKFYINELSLEDVSSYRSKTYEVTATRRINLLTQLYTSF